MDNDNYRLISNSEFASSLGITPEQLDKFRDDIKDNPIGLAQQIASRFEAPQIDTKSTPAYKLQQIVEQGEQQISEFKTTNEQLGIQVKLLEQQRDLAIEQKALLEAKFENGKLEKAKAVEEAKRNKVWSIIGKLLSVIVGTVSFAITLFTALYPEKSKEILSFIWHTLFPGS